jgi:hypothetical protein
MLLSRSSRKDMKGGQKRRGKTALHLHHGSPQRFENPDEPMLIWKGFSASVFQPKNL